MKIYTKTGDKGQTSLIGGTRVAKSHLRIESYGTVDELNSYLGLIGSHRITAELNKLIEKIQNDLFVMGSELASDPGKSKMKIPHLTEKDIQLLEQSIDRMNEDLEPLRYFILPGGNPLASFCHIARCICRRAERIAVHLAEESAVDPQILVYLNRLSDWLFVLARKVMALNQTEEIKWIPDKGN